VVECDPARAEQVRRNWPFFRDRRIDAYGGLTSRWLARHRVHLFRTPIASGVPAQRSDRHRRLKLIEPIAE